MTIADRIRNKRNELDYSQAQLAYKAGYNDKTAISKFENAGDDITMKQVKRIAKALGVTSAYLMGWEDEHGNRTSHGELIDSYVNGSKMREFIDLYKNATPEAQSAAVLVLKSQQQKP